MAIGISFLKNHAEKRRTEGEVIRNLSIELVDPWSDQPRIYFNQKALANLARGIKQDGQKKPIDVVVDLEKPGHFIIVDGERRWRACKMIGRDKIRAIIVPQEDIDQRLVRSTICNFGGEGHTPYERARLLQRIYVTKKYTISQIAAMFTKSDCWVYQHLSLTKLDQRVILMMDQNVPFESRLKFAIAILLTNLPGDLQFEIAKNIVDNKMRSKAARHYVEVKAAEKGMKVGTMKRPERRRNSLTSIFTLLNESLPAFLNAPDIKLDEFLLSFTAKDLVKLNQLVDRCHDGIKILCAAIKSALADVGQREERQAKRKR